jgi:dihydroxyacid dehydratase/phosphogluconate dehydratase
MGLNFMNKNNKSLDVDINGVGETLRRCLARSIGLRNEDLRKPYVVVAHGWSEATRGTPALEETKEDLGACAKYSTS